MVLQYISFNCLKVCRYLRFQSPSAAKISDCDKYNSEESLSSTAQLPAIAVEGEETSKEEPTTSHTFLRKCLPCFITTILHTVNGLIAFKLNLSDGNT